MEGHIAILEGGRRSAPPGVEVPAVARDGDVETACQQACPTDAIVFGNLAEPKSRAAKRAADERNYRVLDELGTRPNVSYLKKVRHGRPT